MRCLRRREKHVIASNQMRVIASNQITLLLQYIHPTTKKMLQDAAFTPRPKNNTWHVTLLHSPHDKKITRGTSHYIISTTSTWFANCHQQLVARHITLTVLFERFSTTQSHSAFSISIWRPSRPRGPSERRNSKW